MIRRTIFSVFLGLLSLLPSDRVSARALQDEAVLKESVDELSRLGAADRAGFARLARPLLAAGAKALPLLDARLKEAKDAPSFALTRLRDMILWPDTEGAYACRVVGPFWNERGGLRVGMIVLSANGRRVRSEDEYLKVNHEEAEKGRGKATFEVLEKGVPKTVTHPGWNTGLLYRDYPLPLTRYLHGSHRAPAWDEDAKAGLLRSAHDWTATAAAPLAKALEKGCRDPLVLAIALERFRRAGDPEKALALWTGWKDSVRADAHGGGWMRMARLEAGRAAHEAGDAPHALRLLGQAIRDAEAAGDSDSARTAGLARALLIRDTDPTEALRQFENRIGDGRGVKREWVEAMLHLKKTHGQTEGLEKWKHIYDRFSSRKRYARVTALEHASRAGKATQFLIPKRFMFSTAAQAARGRSDGWKGEYYRSLDFSGEPVVRIDPELNFIWFNNPPLEGFPSDGFSIRWTGKVRPPHSDTYSFEARANDHVRIWIGGSLVIDAWKGTKRAQRYFGSIYLEKERDYDIRIDYVHVRKTAHVSLRWTCPRMARAASPAARAAPYWALVFRNNFDVPELGFYASGGYQPDKAVTPGQGTLRVVAPERSAEVWSWTQFGPDVRVEVDAKFVLIPDRQPAYFKRELSVNGLMHEKHEWEIGTALEFPRRHQSHLYLNGRGFGYPLPWLDGRKRHRLAVQAFGGQVEHRLDGRKVDTQSLPGGWIGRAGFRVADGVGEFDNFEIYVPSPEAVDNDLIRTHYDGAASEFLRGNLPACLGHLERAARLQPRTQELGRHFAFHILVRHGSRAEALRVLDERLPQARHPKVLEMFVRAERTIDLAFLDSELRFEELKGTHLSNLNGRVPKLYAPHPVDLRDLKEKGTVATLAAYTDHLHALYRSNRKPAQDVEEALKQAAARHPDRFGPHHRLAGFYLEERRFDEADRVLTELGKRVPPEALPRASNK